MDPITKQMTHLFTISNGIFILVGMIGMLAHAIKKYLAKELSGSIFEYLFTNNPKRSVLAVMTTIGALLGIILGGQIPTQLGAFLMLAFTAGFTADSTVNKDGE